MIANSQFLFDRECKAAKHSTAIDAGANDGGYTETLLFYDLDVVAFEPIPAMFSKLEVRHGENQRVTLVNAGLSDVSGVVNDCKVFWGWVIGPDGTPGTLPTDRDPRFIDAPGFDMQLTTIDDYFADIPVGVIKLDVDGYEFRVLRGAQKVIARDRPPILCEFNCYINKLGEDPADFLKLIFDMGYTIWSMDGKQEFTTVESSLPHWPYHSSFDVMLLPKST